MVEHCCGAAILEGLVTAGRLGGVVSGGRQEKAVYIPTCYTRAQNDWVDSFYRQNGYLGLPLIVWLSLRFFHVNVLRFDFQVKL